MNPTWTRYLPSFVRRKLAGRHGLEQVIDNTGWLFANNILRMAVQLVVGIAVTRYLGPERFGLLSYCAAFVAVFTSVATLGLDWIVVRNVVREPERRDAILGTAFLLKLAAGLLSFGLNLLAIFFMRPSDPLSRLLVAIIGTGIVFQSLGTINYWFQAQVQSKYSVLVKSGAFLLVSAAKVLFILLEAPLVAFAWAAAAEVILGAVGFLAAYRSQGLRVTAWRADRATALELLRDAWPLLLTEIVMLAYLRIDQILLGELAGNRAVGIYSVAVHLTEAWYFVPMAINSSLFPGVVAAREEGEERFRERLQRFYNLMAFLGYAVALPVTVAANWVVPLLYGEAYAEAGPMLTGLIWAALFINLSIARSSYLTVMNWTRIHFVTDFMGCALNIGLNFVLIPRYGGMGAVFASLFSYWFAAHGSCFLFRSLRDTGAMLTRAMLYPKFW